MGNNLIVACSEQAEAEHIAFAEHLERAGQVVPLLRGVWHVASPLTASALRDRLAQELPEAAQVLVVDATNETIAVVGVDAGPWRVLTSRWCPEAAPTPLGRTAPTGVAA